MIKMFTIANLDFSYFNLRSIALGLKDDVFCYYDINSD